MIWWILLFLLIVLLLLPIGLVVGYKEQKWDVYLKLGPCKFRLYPKSTAKDKSKSTSKGSANIMPKQAKPIGRELQDFFPIFKTLLAFLDDFRKSVSVNNLQIKVILAGGDPCDLSIHYGYACAAAANLLPHMNNLIRIRKQRIEINCDYVSEQSVCVGLLDMSLPVVLFLKLALLYGARIFKQYHCIKTKEKAV